jgi:hypothetical protein
MGQEKRGIVYIADWPWPEDLPDMDHALDGHWETGDPDRPVEQGPGWDDAEEAIEWGRQRAPRVFIPNWRDDLLGGRRRSRRRGGATLGVSTHLTSGVIPEHWPSPAPLCPNRELGSASRPRGLAEDRQG